MAVGAIIWLPQDKYATLYSIVSLIIITESAHCSHLNIFTHLHILIASLFQIEEAELSIMNSYDDS